MVMEADGRPRRQAQTAGGCSGHVYPQASPLSLFDEGPPRLQIAETVGQMQVQRATGRRWKLDDAVWCKVPEYTVIVIAPLLDYQPQVPPVARCDEAGPDLGAMST